MNKRGLGRGLGALLSSTPGEGEDALLEIPVGQIDVNPLQPRKAFDSNTLNELVASIRSSGVIQPVIVRRLGAGYQLIAGERRWRAARLAGLDRIPALVREATDAQSLELALVENLLRDDLNPMEEAEAYQNPLPRSGGSREGTGRGGPRGPRRGGGGRGGDARRPGGPPARAGGQAAQGPAPLRGARRARRGA